MAIEEMDCEWWGEGFSIFTLYFSIFEYKVILILFNLKIREALIILKYGVMSRYIVYTSGQISFPQV